MKIEILSRAKRKIFIEALGEFGIEKVDEVLIRSGTEKIRAFSGDLNREEIMDLWRVLPVEGIGLYVVKDSFNRKLNLHEVRPTVDGLHVWKEQIGNRVVEVDGEWEDKWIKGEDIEWGSREFSGGFVAVRSKSSGDFIGVGKVAVDGQMLFNFMPKERRRRERTS